MIPNDTDAQRCYNCGEIIPPDDATSSGLCSECDPNLEARCA